MRDHSAESNRTDGAGASLQAEVEELRRRLAALEARASGRDAGRTFARSRPTAKRLALLVAGVVLFGATVVFGQGAVEALFISKEGNVGIGTNEPGAAKLRITNRAGDYFDVRFPQNGGGLLDIVGWEYGWNISSATSGKNLYLNRDVGESSNVLIGRKDRELFVRGSDGNVGIGTNTPANKLSVAGNADVSGTLTAKGSLQASGDLTVGGTVKSQGSLERYQRDDQPETTYTVSPRYHLSLTAAAYGGRTRQIPQQTLNDLCGDQDGCEVRLAMRRYASDTGSQAASTSALFYYSESDGHWRTNAVTGGDAVSGKQTIGLDGNSRTEHIMNAWGTCFFTDAVYNGYHETGTDTVRGLYLLVWKDQSYPDRTCEMTLID